MEVIVSPVRLLFSLDSIKDCAVSSNWLYLVINATTVVRINLESPGSVENISIPQRFHETCGQIMKIWLDAKGTCMLAVTTKLEHFFYCDSSQKPEFVNISKLKGTPTLSVVFHPLKRGRIYLGTKIGTIYEVLIDTSAYEHYFKRDTKSATQVWRGGSKDPIKSMLIQNSGKQLLITFGNQILSFQTGSDAQTNWSKPKHVYTNPFDSNLSQLVESPDKQTLAVVLDSRSIGIRRKESAEFEVCKVDECKFLMLTDFHAIGITPTKIEVIRIITNEIVYTSPIASEIKGCSTDFGFKTFWMFDLTDLFEIKLLNETAGMWRTLVGQNKFVEALEVCDSTQAKSYVYEHYGYSELETNAEFGAQLLGKSDAPFETLVYKVMNTKNDTALKALCKARLSHTASKLQQTLLTSMLASMGEYEELGKYAFDPKTVQQIMRTRADFTEYVQFSVKIGDYLSATQHYIETCQWKEALTLIRQHGSKNKELVYTTASILLENCAKECVESWMRISGLDTDMLIPSLLTYSSTYRGPNSENQALRYLKRLVYNDKNKDESVFETLVSILCLSGDSDTELLTFLQTQMPKNYENDFILRLTLKYSQYKCAVYLYTQMGLYEEAVLLCLKVGTEELFKLSIEIAETEVAANEELRKHLLRVIAKTAIDKQGPKAAMQFIHLLRIGDLLVQFPEFESLDELAPEVVRSLEHTKNKLHSINSEIDESLKASEDIQNEISVFGKQSVLVEPGESCYSCHFPLATRKFTMFPCQHGFHADCLNGTECALCSDEHIKQIMVPLSSTF